VVENRAYIIGYYGGLHPVDLSDPRHPVPVDHFQQGVSGDRPGWDNIACYQSPDIASGYAYLTEYYSGLQIIRLSGSLTK
jgi:hypothetical protein